MAKRDPTREQRTLRCDPDMRPKEWLRFVQLDLFEKCWRRLGLSDQDLRALEIGIMLDPDGHPVIEGTGGIRKIRFSAGHWDFGKSKGARVYYLYVPSKGLVLLIFVHVKETQDNISAAQKKELKALVNDILAAFED